MKHFGFSAGSFKDVSRVAKINEILWTELFIDNKVALCEEIDSLIRNLNKFKSAIEDSDEQTLKKLLKESRLIKEKLDDENTES